YMTSDADSKGYAAFLEWANLDYVPDPRARFVPVAPARVCVVQYQMRMLKNFDEFAEQCEYFLDVTSEYKCDFILFPEIFTTQLLSFLKAADPATTIRQLSAFTPQYLDLFTRLPVTFNLHHIS